MSDDDFDQKTRDLIPAEIRMISGCRDSQTSADVSNVSQFDLPDPAGRAGGACTAALLKVLYNDHKTPENDMSYIEVLMAMREVLSQGKFSQIPQFSSSRRVDIKETFNIVPPGSSGTRRAVLVGINYVGQQGELSGCHNDVGNIKNYLMEVHGFQEENMVVLMDDGSHMEPTRANIMSALKGLVNSSQAGDSVFFHYSGHGGNLPDDDGDEEDGYDETLIPVDFRQAGQIRDDELFADFVCQMPEGVSVTCLMDCCHSGTILDLPFIFKADGESDEIKVDKKFNYVKLAKIAMTAAPAFLKAFKAASNGNMVQCCTLTSAALLPVYQALK